MNVVSIPRACLMGKANGVMFMAFGKGWVRENPN